MATASLSALVRLQQDDLRVLREFVDALRATKRPERVDADVRHAIRTSWDANKANNASKSNETDEANVDGNGADADLSRFAHTMQSLFARLSSTMKRIDEVEATQPPPPKPASGRAPAAPAGLLSLRDYAVLQAAVEVFFCWSVFPHVEDGLLLPLDRRRPTKTLEISSHVLAWGSKVAETRIVDLEAAARLLATATRSMLLLLLVPSLQPILLPKYAVEVIALLVHGETNGNSGDATGTLASLLSVLPLRLSMASLRAALGQSTGRTDTILAFKKRCGQRLAQLLMEDGGVQTTIEMLLAGVDEGNTQARLQVATLICQCPGHVKPEVYAASLARQVCALFDGSNRQNKLLRETAAVLVSEMATRFPAVLDTEFVVPMFKPLLVYETPDGKEITASETEIAECVALLHVLLCGPPPAKTLVLALVPVFRPLVHLFGFAVASKSLLGPPLEETLIAFIKAIPSAATLLQISVLPIVPPLRPSLAACGPRRVRSPVSSDPQEACTEWAPLYEFCPGGTGGIAMRVRPKQLVREDAENDPSTPLRLAVVGMMQLLAAKELENSVVVGELFSSLLLTYMRVRKSMESGNEKDPQARPAEEGTLAAYEPLKAPRDALGLELTLSLLLAIIESLGPSVLRSAETVLQCLTTVLGMFAREKTSIVDAQQETPTEGEDDHEEDDDVLTVCLGVLMTILEAGASQRSESEERELRAVLPVLETLSRYPRPQISELATNARASILSRGAATGETPKQRVEESFEQTLLNAAEDMQSPLVPLRARGVVTLTKLVRRSESHRNDAQWTPRITQLMTIFIAHLADAESYVYLAAVQGLAALADAHPDVAIPLLTANLRDKTNSLETRIKLSEALLFTAKRCGETLPKYAKVFVYTYLECIRPPPRPSSQKKTPFSLIQEIDPMETKAKAEPTDEEQEAQVQAANAALVEATLRASCLSNLAEVSALLQWSLAPFASDILSCVFGILQLELDMSASSVVAVRRGAVFLLKYVLQLLGYKIVEVLPDQLKPMYHTLKHVARVDKDDVVRFHAQHALQALDEIMRGELFPLAQEQEDALGGLRALRIVKH